MEEGGRGGRDKDGRGRGGVGDGEGDRGGEWIGAEIVEPSHPQQGAVGAIDIFRAVPGGVVLQTGQDGAAVGHALVRDAGQLYLGARCEAADVERFEGGFGKVETTVEQSVYMRKRGGVNYLGRKFSIETSEKETITSMVSSFAILPFLPPPWLVGLAQILQLAIARNEMVQRNETAFRQRILEREGHVEVGERPVDQTDAAESIGRGEIG